MNEFLKQSAETRPTSIRINKELLEKITTDAYRDKRSVSKQIEYMLTQYYEMKNLLK